MPKRRLPSFRHRFEYPALLFSLALTTAGLVALLNIPIEFTIDARPGAINEALYQLLAELAVLAGLALAVVVGASLFVGWRARRKLAHLRLGAVLVGPKQFPELHALSEECRQRFGVTKRTNVYVVDYVPSGTPQVATRGFVLPPYYLIVTTAQINTRTPEEMRFLFGREYGHILLGHVPVLTIIDTLSGSLGRVPLLGGLIKWIFQGWTRLANYSADRAGLIAVHDLSHVYSTLVKLIIGAVAYERLDHSVLAEQARLQRDHLHQEMILRLYEPFDVEPLGRFQELLRFVQSPVYRAWRPEELPAFEHEEHWAGKRAR